MSQSASRFPALASGDFARLWSGLLVSNVGTWMQNVAQSWLIYKMTGNDPIYLGLLGLAFAIPMVLIPPIGGAVADRVDRVRLLYFTQTAAASLAALLAILEWHHLLRPMHLLATTFTGACLLAFDNPARQALIPELVSREALPNALALNAATFTGAALVGPALAGVCLRLLDAGWVFAINAASFVAVLLALVTLENKPPRPAAAASWEEAVFGGLRYVAEKPRPRSLLICTAVAAVCGRSYQQLLPIFADDKWHRGAGGYGALLGAGGAGALLGAVGLSALRTIPNKEQLLLGSGLAFSAVLALFSFTPWFNAGVVLLVAAGILSTAFTTMAATILQLESPGALRGRVMGLYAITLIGLPALGSLGSAAAARALSAPRAVAIGAGLMALTILASAGAILRHRPK